MKLHAPRRHTSLGFTLIEIMITVGLVSVLAAVAVPQYSQYISRGRIPDATSALATKAVLAEQFFQDNRTYAGAPSCAADTTTSKYFSFSCTTATATGFTLRAVGTGSMAGFTYTLNQAGAKATSTVPSGWTTSTTCWVVKKDGSC
jgi:type IV pilus assembly protein PilE